MSIEARKCEYYQYTRNAKMVYSEKDIKDFLEVEQYNNETIIQSYAYAINDADSNDVKEYNEAQRKAREDKEFFLLYFLPKLPTSFDTRYDLISKYANKEYAFGMEKTRCLEFEIMARDKDNVYAIEEAIKFYTESVGPFFQYKLSAIKNDLHIYQEGKFTFEGYASYIQLEDMLKELRLIEYKFYKPEYKFLHWAINPSIYEIINWYKYKDNVSEFKHSSSSINYETNLLVYLVESIHDSDKWFESTRPLNPYTFLRQKSTIYKNDDYFRFPDLYSHEYSKQLTENKITYTSVYPKVREYSKLNIELDLDYNKDVMRNYLKNIIDDLYKALEDENSENESSDNIMEFNLSLSSDDKSRYQDNFFVYDYFTYRLEQLKHMEKYKYKDDDEVFEKLDAYSLEQEAAFTNLDEEIISKYFDLINANKPKGARDFILKELKKTTKSEKEIIKDIYKELTSVLIKVPDKEPKTIGLDSVKDYIENITALINKSKTTPYFLMTKKK